MYGQQVINLVKDHVVSSLARLEDIRGEYVLRYSQTSETTADDGVVGVNGDASTADPQNCSPVLMSVHGVVMELDTLRTDIMLRPYVTRETFIPYELV